MAAKKKVPTNAVTPKNASRKARIEVFKDAWQSWHWQLVSSNGKVMAQAAKGFNRKNALHRSLAQIVNLIGITELVEMDLYDITEL